jgi:outer membrane protein W
MKKITLILLVLFVFYSFAFTQDFAVDKGSVIFSAIASYNSQGGDLFENADGDRATTIMLAPAAMFFIMPNIGVGGSASYNRQAQGDNSYSTIGIGPSVAYYYGNAESTMFPYLGAGFRYNIMGDKDDKVTGTDIAVGLGLLYPVKKSVGVVIEAGYHIMNLKHEDWDESMSGDIIMVGVGIAGILF